MKKVFFCEEDIKEINFCIRKELSIPNDVILKLFKTLILNFIYTTKKLLK